MNKQRTAVYAMRRALLEGQDQKERVIEIIEGILGAFVDARCPDKMNPANYDWHGLETDILTQFGVKIRTDEVAELGPRAAEAEIFEQLKAKYQEKEDMLGPELMRETERWMMLTVIDNQWKDHLLSMDHLKEGIGLRSYAQKDPLIEYKKESYQIYQDMMDRIEDETIRYLFFMQRVERPVETPEDPEAEAVAVAAESREAEAREAQSSVMDFTRSIQRKKDRELAELQFAGGESSKPQQPVLAQKRAGRNDPCPCGSGKKYKKCCAA